MSQIAIEELPDNGMRNFDEAVSSDEDATILKQNEQKLKNSKRRAKRVKDKDEEALEEYLFGPTLVNHEKFFNVRDRSPKSSKTNKKIKKEAWVDDDDLITAKDALVNANKYPKKVTEQVTYRSYLVEKFESIYGRPKWVEKAESTEYNDSDEEDSDLLGYAGDVFVKTRRLPKGQLAYDKCAPLTLQEKMKSIIASVQFHPESNLALIASQSGQINIVQVDGDTNPKMQSIFFENFPLSRARFSIDGKELIAGPKSALGYFYSYDMIKGTSIRVPLLRAQERLPLKSFVLSPDGKYIASCGRGGNFYLFTNQSKEVISTFKLNDEVYGLSFTPDSTKLVANGDEGSVFFYDIRSTKRCVHRFLDEGVLGGRSIAISPNSLFLTTGDQSGLINIYKYQDVLTNPAPKPLKSLNNLESPVGHLKFNSSSEMLLSSSGFKDNSARIVHIPSCSVYPNFPRQNTQYKHITEMDVSPNNGYLTMANNLGVSFLFRLNHYLDY